MEGRITPNSAPIAVADSYSVHQGEMLYESAPGVLANDTDADQDPLTAFLTSGPANAMYFMLNDDGSFDYEPMPGFAGADQFSYQAFDGLEYSNVVSVAVNITNEAPVGVADNYSVHQGNMLNVPASGVLANDTDADQDPLTAVLASGPAHAMYFMLNEDGSFDYEPMQGFAGADSFSYQAFDGADYSNVTTVTLDIVNDSPVAMDDVYAVDMDQTLTVTATAGVLANDTDPDNDPLTILSNSNPAFVMLAMNPDGSFTYTPNAGYTGQDSFTYTATDGVADSSANVFINVTNTPPVAANDSYTLRHDAELDTYLEELDSVLANDADPDGDELFALLDADAQNGWLSLFPDGHFIYIPDPGYVGSDSFTYVLTDGTSFTYSGVVSLTIENDDPTAQDDVFAVAQGVALDTFDAQLQSLLDNDLNPDADEIFVSSHTDAAYGTVFVFDDGHFVYFPDVDYVGPDSFTYTITDGAADSTATVSLTVGNQQLIAEDDYYTVSPDRVFYSYFESAAPLLENDSDPDGGEFFVSTYTQAAFGDVVVEADGHFIYTPQPGFVGTDTFSYTITDDAGGDVTANVTIDVANQAPAAAGDAFTAKKDLSLDTAALQLVSLLNNDSDPEGDPLTAALDTAPAHGNVTVNADGHFVYTPDAGYVGADSFTYTVSDGALTAVGTVNLDVIDANGAPSAANDSFTLNRNGELDSLAQGLSGLLGNDTDPEGDVIKVTDYIQPEHGTVTIASDGHFTYTPILGYFGPDSFTYTVSDGGSEATAFVSLEVVNHAPVIGDDGRFAVQLGQTITGVNLLENDSDPDGDGLSATLVTGPTQGTLTFNNDGTFDYTAPTDWTGTVTFNYTVEDGTLTNTPATATIDVVRVVTWDSGGDGVSWDDADNWDTDALPDAYSHAVIGMGTIVTLSDTAPAATIYSVDIQGDFTLDGSLTLQGDSQITGVLTSTGALHLEEDAFLAVTADGSTLSGTIQLDAGSQISLFDYSYTFDGLTVTGDGFLDIQNAFVDLTGQTTQIANSALHGAAITGPSTYKITDTFNWYGGDISGPGWIEIQTGATFNILAGTDKSITNRFIDNSGHINWSSAATIDGEQVELYNLQNGVIEIAADATLQSIAVELYNSGTIRLVDDYYSVAVFDVSTFENAGSIDLQYGSLTIQGGTFEDAGSIAINEGELHVKSDGYTSGAITVAENGRLVFAADQFELKQNSQTSGQGTVSFTSGWTTINGTFSANTVSINNATAEFNINVTINDVLLGGQNGRWTGTGTLDVADQMTWTTGIMDGGGITTIAQDAVLNWFNHEFYTSKSIGAISATSRLFNNNGTINWYGGQIHLSQESAFLNMGTINVFGNDPFTKSGNSTLVNMGVIHKQQADARPVSQEGTYFSAIDNSGTITIDSGKVSIVDGQSTGTIDVATDASVQFIYNMFHEFAMKEGSQVTGDGTFIIDGSRLDVQTDLTISRLILDSGELSGSGILTVTNQLTWAGGTMNGAGETRLTSGAILHMVGNDTKYLQDRLLNNAGHVTWSGNGYVSSRCLAFYNPAHVAQNFVNASRQAWNQYLEHIEAARGPTDGPGPNGNLTAYSQTLIAREAQAINEYDRAEYWLATEFERQVFKADEAYENALDQAQEIRDAADPEDLAADEQYWESVALAEEAYDLALEGIGEWYTEQEAILWQQYESQMASAQLDFDERVTSARFAYLDDLRNAGNRGTQDIYARAGVIHDIIFQQGDFAPENYQNNGAGPSGPPSIIHEFSIMTAETRAALAVAYQRRYGRDLETDINAQYPYVFFNAQHFFQHSSAAVMQAYTSGQGPAPTGGENMIERLGSWVNTGVTYVGSLNWNDVTQGVADFAEFADSTWNDTVTFVTDTAQMMRDDPMQFIHNVGEGLRDTSAVAANTFTFGLIPDLNQYSERLVAENTFYRVVQIGAVFGREILINAAIGAATGGAGNLALAGARYAGQAAARMIIQAGGRAAGQAVIRAAGRIGCRLAVGHRLIQPYLAYQQLDHITYNIDQAAVAINNGDYEGAAAMMGRSVGLIPGTMMSMRDTARLSRATLSGNPQNIRNYLSACFAAGTPILGEHGPKPIEQFVAGDKVWARNEHDPDGPVELKEIEECFITETPIFHLHLRGEPGGVSPRIIRTTDEHPFYAVGKGWTATKDLSIGDLLVCEDGQLAPVDDILDTGEVETVYNFRVAYHHTYFVGGGDWGFAVWAHNACLTPVARRNMPETTTNGYRVYGTAQATTSGGQPTAHAANITARVNQITANLQAQGVDADDVMILMNRSWTTALNGGANVTTSRIRPDIIVVQRLANGTTRLGAYEALSPGNGDPTAYQNWLIGTWSSIVSGNSNFVRGIFQVF